MSCGTTVVAPAPQPEVMLASNRRAWAYSGAMSNACSIASREPTGLPCRAGHAPAAVRLRGAPARHLVAAPLRLEGGHRRRSLAARAPCCRLSLA